MIVEYFVKFHLSVSFTNKIFTLLSHQQDVIINIRSLKRLCKKLSILRKQPHGLWGGRWRSTVRVLLVISSPWCSFPFFLHSGNILIFFVIKLWLSSYDPSYNTHCKNKCVTDQRGPTRRITRLRKHWGFRTMFQSPKPKHYPNQAVGTFWESVNGHRSKSIRTDWWDIGRRQRVKQQCGNLQRWTDWYMYWGVNKQQVCGRKGRQANDRLTVNAEAWPGVWMMFWREQQRGVCRSSSRRVVFRRRAGSPAESMAVS